jgi:four helix bundle protein
MTQQNKKVYDLEERTFEFAKAVAIVCKQLPKNSSNIEYARQLIRAAGSVGANYIEANESLGKKDFQMRVKISRKEAKESAYWIRLLIETNSATFHDNGKNLYREAVELKKILSSMLKK